MIASEIMLKLGMPCQIIGKEDRKMRWVAPLSEATEEDLTFCDQPGSQSPTRRPFDLLDEIRPMTDKAEVKIISRVNASGAGIVICPPAAYPDMPDKTLLVVENPRVAFMNLFRGASWCSIDLSSVVNYNCVKIGAFVGIGPGSVIGRDGFGFWRMKSGEVRKFPQLGGVIIGDNVEIHSNVCIDRGALGDTVIGAGSKIDNFVHIAHNCKVGKNCVIVAHAMIGGSTTIGDNSWVGPSASILNSITIGSNCIIGMGSVVLEDVPDNSTAFGVPARNKNRE